MISLKAWLCIAVLVRSSVSGPLLSCREVADVFKANLEISPCDTVYSFAPDPNLLGQGASGTTYRLKGKLGQEFAGKVVLLDNSDAKLRYVTEVERLNQFKKAKNIIQLYDFQVVGAYGFYLMELGKNGSLKDFITANKFLYRNARFALRMFLGLLNGVKEIHDAGFVHRDLKPANAVVTRTFQVKVIDLELLCTIGTYCGPQGTPLFKDLPLLLGRKDNSHPTHDVFALGVILYQMFHGGTEPFQANSVKDLTAKVAIGDYKIAATTHGFAAYLISKFLRQSPSDRLTVDQAIVLLEAYLPYIDYSYKTKFCFTGGIVSTKNDYELKDFMTENLKSKIAPQTYTDRFGKVYSQDDMLEFDNWVMEEKAKEQERRRQEWLKEQERQEKLRLEAEKKKKEEQARLFKDIGNQNQGNLPMINANHGGSHKNIYLSPNYFALKDFSPNYLSPKYLSPNAVVPLINSPNDFSPNYISPKIFERKKPEDKNIFRMVVEKNFFPVYEPSFQPDYLKKKSEGNLFKKRILLRRLVGEPAPLPSGTEDAPRQTSSALGISWAVLLVGIGVLLSLFVALRNLRKVSNSLKSTSDALEFNDQNAKNSIVESQVNGCFPQNS